MRTVRLLTAALLSGAGLLAAAAPAALADTATPSADPSASAQAAGPTEAGTTFRTAAAFEQGQRATADASTGDYLYWVFPADAGQRTTVKATVKLPESAARSGSSTWQVDVYDGLRRRQPCTYGMQKRTAAKDTASVDLSCTLRPVRAWADTWANEPLPGSYYVRLTVTSLPEQDLGQPISAQVEAVSADAGGAYAVDGALAAPLGPAKAAAREEERALASGWSAGWWSDRWIWTAAGGLLGALAGIAGYTLTRGRGRPSRVPPAV
ncbi:hypothetical protein AB0C77_23745 [Streptomyces sp. NPDC048629]|uniref:hypothetical protein n=1 Tax=Streptomyces sp. NPDC048629 TaxID=3154824 RepID=UPI00343D36C5